jgi:hypothetical protein
MYIDVVNDTDNVNVFVQVDKLAANPDAYNVLRCLEAYLLLLFGCVLVNNTHEDIVDVVRLRPRQQHPRGHRRYGCAAVRPHRRGRHCRTGLQLGVLAATCHAPYQGGT